MKIIVTGGAGFIGSNLVDKLVTLGHKVTVIDNLITGSIKNLKKSKKKIKFIKKSILDKNLNRYFKKIDCIFHLAGLADIVPSIENPKKYFENNVTGSMNILEFARKHKVKKFIYAASASCYGTPKKIPINEKDKIDTKYPYALSKNLAEQMIMHWGKIYNINTISTRFFNVYGRRSRTTGAYGAVFGVFLAQRVRNNPLTIVGDGTQTRDFIHINDLVEALIKVMRHSKKNEIFNIASGCEVSINEIAKLIGGKKVNIPKRPGEPDRSLADISKIKKRLNWKPKINIKDGVQDLVNNIKDYETAPLWTPKKIAKATKQWFKQLKGK